MSENESILLKRAYKLWDEARVEIRQRVTQRDQYVTKLAVSLAAVIGASITYDKPLIIAIAPIISIYFCLLIDYSYKVHQALSQYLANNIESQIKELIKTSLDDQKPILEEYETMFLKKGLVGPRKLLSDYIPYSISILLVPVYCFCFNLQKEHLVIILLSSVLSSIYWWYRQHKKENS